MKLILILVAAVLLPGWLWADTTYVVPGNVSGVWTAEGSPYFVQGNLTIPSGETLHVEPGVEVQFRGPFALTVYGTLDARGTADDSIRFFQPDTTMYAQWVGLRFPADGPDCQLDYCIIEYARAAYAVVMSEGRNLELNHCTVARGRSHGIWFLGPYVLHLNHCAVLNNGSPDLEGSGIRLDDDAMAFLEGCRVAGNVNGWDGAGLYVREAGVSIRNSVIEDNQARYWGGGVYLVRNGLTEFQSTQFNRNRAGQGGGVYSSTGMQPEVLFDHCVFDGNGARPDSLYRWTEGSAARLGSERYRFLNCTFIRNVSESGRMITGGSACEFNSCIFAANGRGSLVSTYRDLTHCVFWGNSDDLQPNPVHLGLIDTINANGDSCDRYLNLFLDPLFVDTAAGDFHLQAESPCINAGDPQLPRDPDGTIADIGAFYFPEPQVIQPERTELPVQAVLYPAYPNPFNALTRLEYDLHQAAHVRLRIFDLAGREVAELAAGPQPAGHHAILWNAGGLASGVYLAVLEPGPARYVQKVILLK